MRRSSVRFRQAAPPKPPGQDPDSSPGGSSFPASIAFGAPELLGCVPEVLVDQVPVEVQGEAPRDPGGDRRRRRLASPARGRDRWPIHRCGQLAIVGRTVPLKPSQSAQLAAVLEPARTGNPWPDEIGSQVWGGRDTKKPLVKVEPTVVAEMIADAATQAGRVRHGMRFVRIRAELHPEDLPTLPGNGEDG
jgi:hypothetical protein